MFIAFICRLFVCFFFFGLMSNVVCVGLENSSSYHLYPYFT